MTKIQSSKINKIIDSISTARGLDVNIVRQIVKDSVSNTFRLKGVEFSFETDQHKLEELDRFEINLLRNNIMYSLNVVVMRQNYDKIRSMVNKIIMCRVKHFSGIKYVVEWNNIDLDVFTKQLMPMEKLYKDAVYSFCVEHVYLKDDVVKAELSRNSDNFVKALMMEHIPEIQAGEVEIGRIARTPGYKSIIGVFSESGKDPISLCIGSRGIRMRAIINEMNGERVEIVRDDHDMFLIFNRLLYKIKHHIIETTDRIIIIVDQDENVSKIVGRNGLNIKTLYKFFHKNIEVFTKQSFDENVEENRKQIEYILEKESVFENEIDNQIFAKRVCELTHLSSLSYKDICNITKDNPDRVFCKLLFWCVKTKDAKIGDKSELNLIELQKHIESFLHGGPDFEDRSKMSIFEISNIILESSNEQENNPR